MSDPNPFYQAARAKFDADDGFKARARDRVVLLQSGDPQTLAIAATMPRAIQEIYNLGPVQSYLRNQALPGGVATPNLLSAIGAQQGAAQIRGAIPGNR